MSPHLDSEFVQLCKRLLGCVVLLLQILTQMIIRKLFTSSYKLRDCEMFLLKEIEFLLKILLNGFLIFINGFGQLFMI